MALVSIPPLFWPGMLTGLNSYTALTAATFDAATDKYAFVFQCPKAGTLDRMEWLIGAITTWPTGGVSVGWQNLTETATPSVPSGAMTHSVNVTVSPGAGWWNPGSFVTGGSSKRTVSRGEVLACVVEVTSGTTSFTLMQIDDVATALTLGQFPYRLFNSTGSYAYSQDYPTVALFYDGESNPTPIHPIVLPVSAMATRTVSSANPKYAGLYWTAPVACKVSGMWIRADIDAITKFAMIADNAGTPLASATWDNDRRGQNANGFQAIWFDTEVTVAAGDVRRFIIDNNASATTAIVAYWTLPGAGYRAAWPHGIGASWTQSNDGTTWSQTTTEMPLCGPIITALDDGVSSGGSTYSRGRVVNV